MRIAIDARILRTSTGRYVERLLHYLQEIDHSNEYIVLLDKKDFEGWMPTNPKFSKISVDIPNYSFREQINFAFFLRRLHVDLVHFAMPQQPILFTGPSVATIHDLTLLHFKNYEDNNPVIYNIKQLIFRFVLRFAVRKSRFVLAPTNYTKQDIVKTFHTDADKVVVTYESADQNKTDEAVELPYLIDKPFIMYVGRMDPYKNIRRLIEAHQQLLPKRPDLQLALVGAKDGNVKALESWVNEQKFKHVRFLGFVSDAQLRWLFEHTQAYVFPSLSEGFGLPGLEALKYGAPLVSSNATCLPEVYQDGAHYFNPQHVEDITQKIDEVLQDERLRAQLIAQGTKVVASYSWKRMAQETLDVYERALPKNK